MTAAAFSCRSAARRRARALGMSLVELVVVIAISGIIAATVAIFVIGPIRGYDAQVRRAELVDAAESALRRMQRDIRGALPNSIRVHASGRIIEMLPSVDGGRYRANPPGNTLVFDGVDTDFEVIGRLQNVAAINTGNNATNHWVVINNQTTTGDYFNAYDDSGHNRSRLRDTAVLNPVPPTDPQVIVLQAAFPGAAPGAPAAASQHQRFFIVDQPVTYLCDAAARTLTRYSGYAINEAQPTDPSAAPLAGASAARVADQVAECVFSYQPGTNQRAGLVTLDLTIEDTTVGERVRLLHQTHVYNVP